MTMREVAQETQASTGTLYHYFQNKEDLFVQMITWMGERDVQAATAHIQQGHSLAEKLALLFDFIQQEESYFRRLFLLAMDYYRHAPSTQDSIISRVIASYRLAIQEHLGLLDPAMASVLLSVLLGVISQNMMDPGSVSYQTHLQVLQQLIDALG